MPLTFINGGAPDYRGQIFQTSGELLDLLETHLVTAGWVSIQKVAATSLLVKGISANAHECFIRFEIKTNTSITDGRYLVCRGFLAVDLTQGSPDDYHRFTFQENNINRLWLTADEDSGCLCVYGANTSTSGYHFGFLNRVEPTDPNAWMVGWIHSLGLIYSFVARSKHNNVVWRNLKSVYDYISWDDFNNRYTVMPVTTFDALARGKPYNIYGDGNGVNVYNQPYDGKENYTGQPLIDQYSYLEGRGSTSDYAATQISLYFRGVVKHAYCGVSQYNALKIFTDPFTSNVILSVGGNRWQGMRIA